MGSFRGIIGREFIVSLGFRQFSVSSRLRLPSLDKHKYLRPSPESNNFFTPTISSLQQLLHSNIQTLQTTSSTPTFRFQHQSICRPPLLSLFSSASWPRAPWPLSTSALTLPVLPVSSFPEFPSVFYIAANTWQLPGSAASLSALTLSPTVATTVSLCPTVLPTTSRDAVVLAWPCLTTTTLSTPTADPSDLNSLLVVSPRTGLAKRIASVARWRFWGRERGVALVALCFLSVVSLADMCRFRWRPADDSFIVPLL